MQMNSMLKGLGIGVIAGAVLTAAVVPMDARRLRRSKPMKAIRALGHMVEGISASLNS